jgi:hypothetical protein
MIGFLLSVLSIVVFIGVCALCIFLLGLLGEPFSEANERAALEHAN